MRWVVVEHQITPVTRRDGLPCAVTMRCVVHEEPEAYLCRASRGVTGEGVIGVFDPIAGWVRHIAGHRSTIWSASGDKDQIVGDLSADFITDFKENAVTNVVKDNVVVEIDIVGSVNGDAFVKRIVDR